MSLTKGKGMAIAGDDVDRLARPEVSMAQPLEAQASIEARPAVEDSSSSIVGLWKTTVTDKQGTEERRIGECCMDPLVTPVAMIKITL